MVYGGICCRPANLYGRAQKHILNNKLFENFRISFISIYSKFLISPSVLCGVTFVPALVLKSGFLAEKKRTKASGAE